MSFEDVGDYLDDVVEIEDDCFRVEEVVDDESLADLTIAYNAFVNAQGQTNEDAPSPAVEPSINGPSQRQKQNAAHTHRKRDIRHLEATGHRKNGDISKDAQWKALQAKHIILDFDVGTLPVSNPGFIGCKEVSPDQLPPISKLKRFNWDGKTTTLLVDRKDRIWTVLGAGIEDKSWGGVVDQATNDIAKFHQTAGLTTKDFANRRFNGRYSTVHKGPSFGGGQKRPANMAIRWKTMRKAMDELQKNADIQRILGHTGTLYKTYGYKLAIESSDCIRSLTSQFPDMEPPKYPNPDGPYWAAFTMNSANVGPLEPQVVTAVHMDFGNYAQSWCAVTVFGKFDPDVGGHLVFWNLGIAIRFPPGTTILFPLALITHSNLPTQPGETQYSIVQYTAGGLFRWISNGGMSDKEFLSTLTAEQLVQQDQMRKDRARSGLRKYTRLFELECGDYKGEVLAEESELSSLGESSDEEDSWPSKHVKIETLLM
ncbi:hypothetical protein VNI00_004668 [Paramarasmius palmivorus]|uniref:Uncharacterized protein n=1 Tax=Paramarasmius palmivorus TaxID=297713 RepID=A0AAW0DJF8_9AGAR